MLSSEPLLKFYDPNKPIKISPDSSKSGLGALLLQKHDNDWFPVAYASRSLTEAEKRYVQIEKECLSIVYACERFYQFVYGQPFECETDHKPLVAIINQKNLNDCPLRIQRLLLRLQKFDVCMTYVPGKFIYTPDAWSRAFGEKKEDCITGEAEVEVYVNSVLLNLQVSDEKLKQTKKETEDDRQLTLLKECIMSGFPKNKVDCPAEIREFWNIRDELSFVKGLLLKGLKVIIQKASEKTC